MSAEYNELLKDPRWLLKRKNILVRDGFQCTVCKSKKTLQVHHTYYYQQPTMPWGYPDESLLTLCEKCHHDWHEWHELEYRDKPKKKKQYKNNFNKPNRVILLEEGFSYKKQHPQQRKKQQKKHGRNLYYPKEKSIGIQERIRRELDRTIKSPL